MSRMIPFFVAAALLCGCAVPKVLEETRETVVIPEGYYKGEQYVLRTRLMEGPRGTFEHTSVVYRGISRTCIKDSPRDCEFAARNLIDARRDSFFGAGLFIGG